jgi:MFS family permease
MSGLSVRDDWTALLPGFILNGIGVGMVNPALATAAVGVVEPRRAGMASGINSTFRQVGIATGVAAWGAIFQSAVGTSQGAFVRDRATFLVGFDRILVCAGVLAAAGAILCFVLIRPKDFVAHGESAGA